LKSPFKECAAWKAAVYLVADCKSALLDCSEDQISLNS